MTNYHEFFTAYLVAILFGERDMGQSENDDTSLSYNGYSADDFADDTRAGLRADSLPFFWTHRRLFRSLSDSGRLSIEQAGHDLYFTRAGHGVGYWDRGLGAIGRMLSDACGKQEYCTWVNDENQVVIE